MVSDLVKSLLGSLGMEQLFGKFQLTSRASGDFLTQPPTQFLQPFTHASKLALHIDRFAIPHGGGLREDKLPVPGQMQHLSCWCERSIRGLVVR
jgi:hypothetical protein